MVITVLRELLRRGAPVQPEALERRAAAVRMMHTVPCSRVAEVEPAAVAVAEVEPVEAEPVVPVAVAVAAVKAASNRSVNSSCGFPEPVEPAVMAAPAEPVVWVEKAEPVALAEPVAAQWKSS